jgi:hypothetical protein
VSTKVARTRSQGSTLRLAALCLVAAMTAACASVSKNPSAVDASGNAVSTLIPNKSYNLTPAVSLSVENILMGAALYWAVDPLAPNWQLEQTPLGADRVRISLRKKRFASGGDGEAAQLLARRAEQLARDGGYAGYTLMEYTESVESTLPLAQRVAQGVIQLNR